MNSGRQGILNPGILAKTAYAVFVILMAVYLYRKPAYNWDMLPYMAIVLQYDHNNTAIHDNVYKTAANEIPPVDYNRLTDSSHAYRKAALSNPAFFNAQLPMYVVKPLYTILVYCSYKLGIPLTKSTMIVSVVAWVLLAILLFVWLKQALAVTAALLVAAAIMISSPLLEVASLSTPDALSALVMTAAVFCLVNKRNSILTGFFFLLAILTRIDNVLPAFIFISTFTFYKRVKQFSFYYFLGITLLMTGLLLLITYQTISYGWGAWYYPDFMKYMNEIHKQESGFSPSLYLGLIKSQLVIALKNSFLWVFMLCNVLLFYKSGKFYFDRNDEVQVLLLLFILAIGLRFLLQPVIADRFYISYYISTIVMLIKRNVQVEQKLIYNAT